MLFEETHHTLASIPKFLPTADHALCVSCLTLGQCAPFSFCADAHILEGAFRLGI